MNTRLCEAQRGMQQQQLAQAQEEAASEVVEVERHVVERLVEAGAQVRALVRYNSRNDHGWLETLDAAIVSETEVYPGDLANPEVVAAAATDRQTVLHLGAGALIPNSLLVSASARVRDRQRRGAP